MVSSDDALFTEAFARLRRYIHGELPLADVVAAFRALPPQASGDVAFGLDEGTLPADAQARLIALGEALASPQA